jgi:hypothetical protein
MGTFYGNQIMRTREAAHRVLIEPSLGDPCTALCVIDRVPKPRAALAAASLSALGLSRRKITHSRHIRFSLAVSHDQGPKRGVRQTTRRTDVDPFTAPAPQSQRP